MRAFISILALATWAGAESPKIIVLGFKNASGFDRPWDLSTDMPKRLAAQLGGAFRANPPGFYGLAADRSRQARALCADAGAAWIVSGRIDQYAIARNGVGTGAVAAFNSYGGRLAGQLQFFRCADDSLRTEAVDLKVRDNELGLRAPIVYIQLTKDKYEDLYAALEKARYGDSVFQATVAGRLDDSLAALARRRLSAAGAAARAPAEADAALAGHVLYATAAEAYIDLGASDGVRAGDSVSVFRRGDAILDTNGRDTLGYADLPLARAVVSYVKSGKLSIITAQNPKAPVAKGDAVRIRR